MFGLTQREETLTFSFFLSISASRCTSFFLTVWQRQRDLVPTWVPTWIPPRVVARHPAETMGQAFSLSQPPFPPCNQGRELSQGLSAITLMQSSGSITVG